MKKNIIISVVFSFFVIVSLFAVFVVPNLKDTEISITQKEYEGTVVNCEKVKNGYLIEIIEYNSIKLFLSEIAISKNWEYDSLVAGEKVFFRFNMLNEPLEESLSEELFIITIRTKDKDIITMEGFYNWEEYQLKGIRKTGVTIAIISGMIVLYNCLKIYQKKKMH